MSGQVLCSLAQPFVMFVTTKFANSWFTENQRALANTVALSSNTFGVLIGAFSNNNLKMYFCLIFSFLSLSFSTSRQQ